MMITLPIALLIHTPPPPPRKNGDSIAYDVVDSHPRKDDDNIAYSVVDSPPPPP